MEVIDVFKSGGPVMYALLLCSICTAVIMFERGMFYHRAGKNLGIFVDNLPDMLLNKSWNDAYADAAQEDNAAAFVAQEGIRAAAEGKDFHTDEEKLRFAARHMPDIFSKGSKYEKYSKFSVTKRQKGK